MKTEQSCIETGQCPDCDTYHSMYSMLTPTTYKSYDFYKNRDIQAYREWIMLGAVCGGQRPHDHDKNCPLAAKAIKQQNLRYYGVENPDKAKRLEGTVTVTVTLTYKADRFYNKDHLANVVRRDINQGSFFGHHGGAEGYSMTNKQVLDVTVDEKRP